MSKYHQPVMLHKHLVYIEARKKGFMIQIAVTARCDKRFLQIYPTHYMRASYYVVRVHIAVKKRLWWRLPACVRESTPKRPTLISQNAWGNRPLWLFARENRLYFFFTYLHPSTSRRNWQIRTKLGYCDMHITLLSLSPPSISPSNLVSLILSSLGHGMRQRSWRAKALFSFSFF